MQFLSAFQTERRDLCHAEPAATPGPTIRPGMHENLIDPDHGLALGYEAALPYLIDFDIEATTPTN